MCHWHEWNNAYHLPFILSHKPQFFSPQPAHSPCCWPWWALHTLQLRAQGAPCSPPCNTQHLAWWGETWTGRALHCHLLKGFSATGPQRVGRVGACWQPCTTADQLGYGTWVLYLGKHISFCFTSGNYRTKYKTQIWSWHCPYGLHIWGGVSYHL